MENIPSFSNWLSRDLICSIERSGLSAFFTDISNIGAPEMILHSKGNNRIKSLFHNQKLNQVIFQHDIQ